MYYTSWDLFLAPIYFILIWMAAMVYMKKYVHNPVQRYYFKRGLLLKIIGGLAFTLIYMFYYGGGDTMCYYLGGEYISSVFFHDPYEALLLFMHSGCESAYPPELAKHASHIVYFCDKTAYFITKVAGLLGVFCFGSYIALVLIFAFLSFTGIWQMYITLCRYYPHLTKQMAWACFYIPSVYFWGSGIMKDTVTIGALGWLFWATDQVFNQKKRSFTNIFILIAMLFLIKSVKVYVLICFVPAVLVWVYFKKIKDIKNKITQRILAPIILVVMAFLTVYVVVLVSQTSSLYNLETIASTSSVTAQYMYEISKENGSAYSLGEQDGTYAGFVKLIFPAINVTLFRPYLWEVKNPVMFLSAFESFVIMCIFLRTFILSNTAAFLKLLTNDYLFLFCFIFVFTTAFAIGVSSYNFGALVRYKIPLMPFFLVIVFLWGDTIKKKKSRMKMGTDFQQ